MNWAKSLPRAFGETTILTKREIVRLVLGVHTAVYSLYRMVLVA